MELRLLLFLLLHVVRIAQLIRDISSWEAVLVSEIADHGKVLVLSLLRDLRPIG